jgi:hypothetical protein
MTELQVPVLDTYLKSSYALGSSNVLFQYIGYSVLCIEQIVATFTPLLYKLITFALLLLIPARQMNEIDDQTTSSSIFPIGTKEKAPEPIILNQYRNFVDDRKAKVGSLSDIQRLRQFGYKPLRFLSPNFIELLGVDESSAIKKSAIKDSPSKPDLTTTTSKKGKKSNNNKSISNSSQPRKKKNSNSKKKKTS